MLADKIPDSWKAALTRIQTAFPEAVIAGGALRDLHFNVPPKDVDVFVRVPSGTEAEEVLQFLEETLGYEHIGVDYRNTGRTKDHADTEYESYNPALVLSVSFELSKPRLVTEMTESEIQDALNEPLLNVIALDLPQPEAISWGDVVTNDFDIGLNRIYFDGNEVVPTIAFSIDAGNHTMTVLRCRDEKELERIKGRLARLGEKYPEFEVLELGVKT